jgi:CheY-like chemotaxis protein
MSALEIVIVDDNAINLMVMKKMLEALQFKGRIHTFADGRNAFYNCVCVYFVLKKKGLSVLKFFADRLLAQKTNRVLIFMDQNLPFGLNGENTSVLLRQMVQMCCCADMLKIVSISASSRFAHFCPSCFDQILEKPLSLDVLRNALDECLR